MDAHKNFAYSHVAAAPAPATSGVSLTVTTAEGTLFPTTPFNAVAWPAGVIPLLSNAEIVRVTNISGDVFTITRAQEGTSAKSIAVGWQIMASISTKLLTDIEAALSPLGTLVEFGGFVSPNANWLLADGAAVARTTYSALMDAITDQQAGTLTTGTTGVTGLADTSRLGIGMKVEGTGIPAGTTIAAIPTGTTLTLSANATANGSQTLRFFAHGNGDGSTTFNLPDRRGRQAVGRGTHTDNSVLGSTDGLGVGSRTQKHGHTHTLTLPNHGHANSLTFSGTPGTTGDDSPDHTHTTPLDNAAGALQSGAARSTGQLVGSQTGGASNRHQHPFTPAGTIGGSIGNPTTNPAISGAVGASGGVSDAGAWIVLNYLIRAL